MHHREAVLVVLTVCLGRSHHDVQHCQPFRRIGVVHAPPHLFAWSYVGQASFALLAGAIILMFFRAPGLAHFGSTRPGRPIGAIARQPKFIVPTIADRLAAGSGIDGLALESALWCRYCAGSTADGTEIAPNDPDWTRLQATAVQARADPAAWLAMADIYGEVGRSPVFGAAFGKALGALWHSSVIG